MSESSQTMVAFLGVASDPRLLDEDAGNLPVAERHHEPAIDTQAHDRLVAAGSFLTGASLLAGVGMVLYGGWRLLFDGGGALAGAVAAVGLLLVATHWGWVHVAEYAGLTIDGHRERAADEERRAWLANVEPYPRFSVSTSVLDDASTRVERVLHRPVLTARDTFTFVCERDTEQTFAADAPVEEIATAVEAMRRQARLETDRLHGLWDAASTAYAAALLSERDDEEHRAAQRAAAIALSEHINTSLREPPVVE
jgi:hypothetical protein